MIISWTRCIIIQLSCCNILLYKQYAIPRSLFPYADIWNKNVSANEWSYLVFRMILPPNLLEISVGFSLMLRLISFGLKFSPGELNSGPHSATVSRDSLMSSFFFLDALLESLPIPPSKDLLFFSLDSVLGSAHFETSLLFASLVVSSLSIWWHTEPSKPCTKQSITPLKSLFIQSILDYDFTSNCTNNAHFGWENFVWKFHWLNTPPNTMPPRAIIIIVLWNFSITTVSVIILKNTEYSLREILYKFTERNQALKLIWKKNYILYKFVMLQRIQNQC